MKEKKKKIPVGLILLIIATVTIFLLAVATSIPNLDILYFVNEEQSIEWPWAYYSGNTVIRIHLLVVISGWVIACLIPAYSVYRYSKRRILLEELERMTEADDADSEKPGDVPGTTGGTSGGTKEETWEKGPGFHTGTDTSGGGKTGPDGKGTTSDPGFVGTPITGGKTGTSKGIPKHSASDKDIHIIFKTFNRTEAGEWTCGWCDIINSSADRSCRICGRGAGTNYDL